MPQYMLYYFLCFLWSFLETSSYSWLSALAAFVSQVCEVLGWGQNTWTHCQMSPWAPRPSALSSWLTNLEAFPLGSLIRKWNAITPQVASFAASASEVTCATIQCTDFQAALFILCLTPSYSYQVHMAVWHHPCVLHPLLNTALAKELRIFWRLH